MALLHCVKCGTLFAVGLKACPHCGGKRYYEEGNKPAPKPKPEES